MTVLAHIGGFPVEELLGLAPAFGAGLGATVASLRARARRDR
jgi:hypothetical protein